MKHHNYNWGQKKYAGTMLSASTYLFSKMAYHLAPNKMTRLLREKGFAVKPYRLSAAQLELLKQARVSCLELDGNQIKVFEWGAGLVILLVHGWGGRALQMDAFVQPLLDKGFKVVAFDHKGHGESSARFSSYPEMVRSTALVAAHYAQELVGTVAHSIGANSIFKVSENIERKLKIAVVAPVGDFLAVLEKMRMRLGIYEKLFARVIRQIEADSGLHLADLTVLDYAKLQRHEVLLVHDKFDRINGVNASHEIRGNLQGASLMQTEMLGHSRILGNREVVQRVVAHFA